MAKTRKVSGRKRISKQTRRGKRGGSIQLNSYEKEVAGKVKVLLQKAKEEKNKKNESLGAFGCGSKDSGEIINLPNEIKTYDIQRLIQRVSSYESSVLKNIFREVSGMAGPIETERFLEKLSKDKSISLSCSDIERLLKRFKKLSS